MLQLLKKLNKINHYKQQLSLSIQKNKFKKLTDFNQTKLKNYKMTQTKQIFNHKIKFVKKMKHGIVSHRSQQSNGQIESLIFILSYYVHYLCFFHQKHKNVKYHYVYGILFTYFFQQQNKLRWSCEKDCLFQFIGKDIKKFVNSFMFLQ